MSRPTSGPDCTRQRVAAAPAVAPAHSDPAERERWARWGLRLVALGAFYNLVEAAIAIGAGVAAHSIALVGFGLDSVIEFCAAAALLWRLRLEARGADGEAVERGEQRVRRFVGATFLALAAYVGVVATRTLQLREPPGESVLGIALAAVSLVAMPLLSWAKMRAASRLASAALRAEAKETLACAYLSFTLLVGLTANAALGWWWADPVAALLMLPWLVREGIEGLRGEE